MRESTFILIFLPLFITAFVPGAINFLLGLPLQLLSGLLGVLTTRRPVPSLIPSQYTPGSACCSTVVPPCCHDRTPDPSSASASTPSSCPPPPSGSMSWFQKTLQLPSRARGSYLVTSEIESQLPEIGTYRVGILHLFLQHTSAALSLNENWDEEVRADMSDALDRIVPEDRKGNLYRHAAEGPDDMPAHVKSALVGASVTVPITNGSLNTGTWQGIWFLEFRKAKHARKIVATIQGEKM